MSEAQNTKIAQDAYAAFGRGDIPGLLGYMTDKAAVGEFFRQVAEAEDFQQFEPREFVAQGDKSRGAGPLSRGDQGQGQDVRR